MLDARIRQAFLQGAGKVFQNDNRLGAGVLELVLQFARGVQRVDVHQHIAGAQNRGNGHGVLRYVGHHDGHPVPARQTQALQVGRQGCTLASQLGISQVPSHEMKGRAIRVARKAVFHQRHQRGVDPYIDIRRNARRVMG